MKKRILILEDNEICRKSLAEIVKSCGNDIIVYEFSSRDEAYTCAMDHKIDLFLLDIILDPRNLNDHSGISFASHLRENVRYFSTSIIFITTLSGLEVDLLKKIHCYDYIEKPIDEDNVKEVVSKLLYQLSYQKEEREATYFRIDGVTYPVYVDEIMYVKSQRRVLTIYLKDEEFNVPGLSIKTFLDRIRSNVFMEPLKGFAVNFDYIEYIDFPNRLVKLKGRNDTIEVGVRRKDTLRIEYNRRCGEKE